MAKSSLRRGDTVMVIAGGNKKTRPIKGQTGKILRFSGKQGEYAVVEGLNMVTKHLRARGPGQESAKVQREAPIHVSRLMFFAEKLKKPVRICHTKLADGTRVRGYKDPTSGEFVQISNAR